jgi:PmbA protein
MDSEQLLGVADQILGWANDDEQVEVVVVHGRDSEVRAYGGEIESLTTAESQGVGIRVIKDSRQGFAYAGTLDPDVLGETLRDARDNATFGTPDEFLALTEPDGVEIPQLDLVDPEVTTFPTERKIEMAIELEKMVLAGDPRVVGVEVAEYADAYNTGAVASTTGIRSVGSETSSYVVAYSLTSDGEDTQAGFGYSVGKGPGAIDLDKAAADAVDRGTRLLGATKPNTEKLTIVFDPYVTAQFLSIIAGTLTGDVVLKGRSLFADRMGETVGSPLITLVDDATNPEAFSATEADGEGLATRRTGLIEAGVLQSFLHNSYTARKAKAVSTGSAVRGYSSTPSVGAMALALTPGTKSQAELIADIPNGLLVQGVSGLHSGVNAISGDFSTGAEGLMIRNGELAEPVREFTIASTLQRMLLDVVAVGGDVERLPMSAAGLSLVVSDVTMSGA